MAPSIWQLLIVLAIIVLLFGTKKLRGIGGDLGSAIKSFKKEVTKEEDPAAIENQQKEQADEKDDASVKQQDKA